MRVSLFVPCLTDLFYPRVAECVVRILRRLGMEIDYPAGQTCCGQPALNSGFTDEARTIAARMIRVFAETETVVTPSGSCCSIVREHFPRLFEHDPAMHQQAVALANRTFDFLEFVEKRQPVDWTPWNLTFPAVATYHYSCHNREIGITPDDTVRLLRRIKGLEYRELEKMEQCCGFGGTFAVKQPEISGAMVRDKVACIKATGADVLVCNDAGCSMNIIGGCRRAGLDIKALHIAEILDKAMSNGRDGAEVKS
ncbi:MAG: (Fe-S)-binding protein [Phycisphaerales bacterium]|nr:(Fe-S)-binding protein [Phycisphaerales bacterium]